MMVPEHDRAVRGAVMMVPEHVGCAVRGAMMMVPEHVVRSAMTSRDGRGAGGDDVAVSAGNYGHGVIRQTRVVPSLLCGDFGLTIDAAARCK